MLRRGTGFLVVAIRFIDGFLAGNHRVDARTLRGNLALSFACVSLRWAHMPNRFRNLPGLNRPCNKGAAAPERKDQ
jgi:hypothetical protein